MKAFIVVSMVMFGLEVFSKMYRLFTNNTSYTMWAAFVDGLVALGMLVWAATLL